MGDDYLWLNESLELINDVEPEGFLLRASTHGQYLDAFRLKPIKIDYFKRKLTDDITRLYERHMSKEIKFVDIYNEDDPNEEDVTVINTNDFQQIKYTIDQIFQNTQANQIDELKTMDKTKFSAMLFSMPNKKSIILFGNVNLIQTNSKKVSIITQYTDIGLKEIKEPILAFDMSFPCIYFEEKHLVLLLNRKIGEEIFHLTEYQKQISEKTFKGLEDTGLIKVDNNVLTAEFKHKTLVNKIAKLTKNNSFTKNIDYYRSIDAKLRENGVEDYEVKIKILDNKLVLDDKATIKSFVDCTDSNYVRTILDEEEDLYLVSSKRKLKRIPKK